MDNIQDVDKLLAEIITNNIFEHMIARRLLSALEKVDLPEEYQYLIKDIEKLSKATNETFYEIKKLLSNDLKDYVNKRLDSYKKMTDMDILW